MRIGVVTIGRNEGERLRRCLHSLHDRLGGGAIVYVDSGSTDGSLAFAGQLGVDVVELDMTEPFTMARARNAGLERLLEAHPDLGYVQFVDGDCEVVSGWIEAAAKTLDQRPDAAVVCGRRRERDPDASLYNRLCDLEWDTPLGEVRACHGDAMMRVEALRQVGGFDARLIAGEEPELCVRLRGAGWKVLRINAEMTLHDSAMTRFGQWWKRMRRAGHAYAEGAWLHGGGPQRHNVRQVVSILLWTLVLPAAALGFAWPTGGWGLLLLLLGYVVLWWRVRRHQRRRGRGRGEARLYASFTVLGKFAQLLGLGQFAWNRLLGRQTRLIEYKGPTAVVPPGARG